MSIVKPRTHKRKSAITTKFSFVIKVNKISKFQRQKKKKKKRGKSFTTFCNKSVQAATN